MCDALSRNLPKPLEVIVGHCLAHARRKFVEVAPSFPAECRHILETLGDVYRVDAEARDATACRPRPASRPPGRRAARCSRASTPGLSEQIDEHRVEPNSGLGRPSRYFLKHWDPLTLFLRVSRARPLTTTSVERALKKAILHRKNALFYKTPTGAQVGDLFMSLIHTCELEGVNPFDYLTALQRHADALANRPPRGCRGTTPRP